MEILIAFLLAAVFFSLIGLASYDSGWYAGIASVPAPEYPAPPAKEYVEQADFPETDPVVFGRYCMMEHQPWECQSFVVYPYDTMHGVYPDDSSGPSFLFQYREDALQYMDIYDRRAAQFQRRDNLINGLEADFGVPEAETEFDWDVFFDNLDDEEGIEINEDIGDYDSEESLS